MLPDLNYDSKDSKFTLLYRIFKIIYLKKFKDTCKRKGITNRQMRAYSIKILFMNIYFNYTVFNVVNELNRSGKLRKFYWNSNREQIYEADIATTIQQNSKVRLISNSEK